MVIVGPLTALLLALAAPSGQASDASALQAVASSCAGATTADGDEHSRLEAMYCGINVVRHTYRLASVRGNGPLNSSSLLKADAVRRCGFSHTPCGMSFSRTFQRAGYLPARGFGEARAHSAELVVFPELAVTGYPPEDLLLRPGFVRAAEESVERIARESRGVTVLLGGPHFDRDLFNACYVCAGGEIKAVYRKRFLPNYGVFDEDRYFAPGRDLILLEHGKTLVGPTVCEDLWQPGPPATDLALAGAELLVNISASPFYVGRDREREEMLVTRARDNSCFVAFCNTVGGQDELIFDGHSVVIDDEGTVLARAPGFEEALLVVDVQPTEVIGRRLRDVRRRALAREREQIPPVDIIHVGAHGPSSNGSKATGEVAPFVDELEQMRLALELGLHDYVDKNGFSEVVVGVSGGIDSAVTAALAAEALGPEHVHCVSMPSLYSSEATRGDAQRLAESLGCAFFEIPIGTIVDAFDDALADVFANREHDLTEENVQARARGV